MTPAIMYSILADAVGKTTDRSTVSYDLVGTNAFQSFSILAALGTIAFSFGDVGLPDPSWPPISCPFLVSAIVES